MTVREADQARRRAVLLLGVLAGTLVLAGLLPWVTGAETIVRMFALPMLLAGLLVTGAAIRVAVVRRPEPATLVERTCEGCACGAGGCATALGAGPADAGATEVDGAAAPADPAERADGFRPR